MIAVKNWKDSDMGLNNDKNTFLIVSADKARIERCTDVLMKNFPQSAVFKGADWFDAKYKIDNVHPKAILIDEYLPKGSGFDIVSKILKEKNNADIFIIIMSYVADTDIYSSEVASGRIRFLTEPDRDQAILDCVSKIIAPKKDESNDVSYQMKHLNAGEILFKEGDLPELAYIVKNGRLKAYSQMPDGDRVEFGEILPGEFVGEMGHFIQEPRSATVEAITEVDLIAIPTKALDNVIFTKPSWSKALVKTLARRLKRANKALTG
jgi:CRP/FNR family cyclic AMP-dependent transcriptional regulator